MRGRRPPRAEVEREQRVPGADVAAGHVVEDEARGGEVADVGVGGEESGPGDDVAAGHSVEQLLSVLDAAAAAVRRELRVEVGRVGMAGWGLLWGWEVVRDTGEGGGGRGSRQSQSGHCRSPSVSPCQRGSSSPLTAK